ncbi:MAG: hypothetical protein ACRDNF_11535 [Streptosporangiaceae bacterium]
MAGQAWTEHWTYEIKDLASLPQADDMDDPPCMTGPGWRRRLGRRFTRRSADCCWYHMVNWHTVSETAIRLAHDAQAAGITVPDVAEYADGHPATRGFHPCDLEALDSLLSIHTGLMIADDEPRNQWISEGRHRITAMRDTHVRRTLLLRLELLDHH